MSDVDVRAAVEAEVYGVAEVQPVLPQAAQPEETVEQQPAESEAAPVDPWAGVPPALREHVESLNGKISAMDEISTRLRTAEGRVSALQSELAKRQQPSPGVDAPTQQQIASVETEEEWELLKEEYPEWAGPIDKRMEKRFAALRAEMPTAESLRSAIVAERQQIDASVGETIERRLLEMKHRNYREVVRSQEFVDFFKTLSPEEQAKASSNRADDAIDLLDAFAAAKKKPSASAERAQRLSNAASIRGTSEPPIKSEDDMTDAEIRSRLTKQIWET